METCALLTQQCWPAKPEKDADLYYSETFWRKFLRASTQKLKSSEEPRVHSKLDNSVAERPYGTDLKAEEDRQGN